jgi:hypothetical protein
MSLTVSSLSGIPDDPLLQFIKRLDADQTTQSKSEVMIGTRAGFIDFVTC